MPTILKNIPTNVITGFLGVGKTTAILNLLKTKPANETWAVLVNEFGKVGIDGQLLKQDGVEIKEVPGGCMCCAAGVSMQVGLNALIAKARPDRLLIEPTGIGHPKQIIKQLSQPPFDSVLDMRACICLVDPRHLGDERYMENEYYQEQLAMADVLVANKGDQASVKDKVAFEVLLGKSNIAACGWVEHGQLDSEWLDIPHATRQPKSLINILPTAQLDEELNSIRLQEGERYRRQENQDKAFFSCGWLLADDIRFDYDTIEALLKQIDSERIKATLQTNKGNYAFNASHDGMYVSQRNMPTENRIEIISLHKPDWSVIEDSIIRSSETADTDG